MIYTIFYKGFFVFFLLLLSLNAEQVLAATQTMSAHIAFDTVLSITNTSGIDFGSVKANQAGTYTVSSTGVVTATNSGVVLGGASKGGSLTIAGSTTQTIDITANNYVSNNGVTPSGVTCAYNGGAAAPCNLTSQAAPAAGKILLIGITVDVDGNQTVNTTASPTFDIVVTYH
ncbi:MAG: hypothetical protein WC612_07020 [Bdellovibrionales bacterium]|jgi:hypothetical protein